MFGDPNEAAGIETGGLRSTVDDAEDCGVRAAATADVIGSSTFIFKSRFSITPVANTAAISSSNTKMKTGAGHGFSSPGR
jgi:hypothetical protein